MKHTKWSMLTPSIIFHGGRVHTVDTHDTIVEALAISGNRILATGSDEDILAMAVDNTRRIDLGHRSIIPGILDTHAHAVEVGLFLKNLFCNGIPSIKDLVDAVAEKIAALPKGEWLQGGCWIETQFSENRMPTRWDLDPVSPEHPVVIERIFSTCVANSCALKLAGVNRNTPDPMGGEIERDPKTGEPTGILHRSAKALVRDIMPTGTDTGSLAGSSGAEIRELACTAMQAFVSYGITGTLEAGVGPDICRAYHDLHKSGDLIVRTSLMPNWYGFTITQNMDQMDRLIDELGFYTGFGDEWLRLSGLKMAIDGGLTSKTALKSWEYRGGDPPGPVPLRLDLGQLDGWVKTAHDAGWSVGIHVMGDTAIEKAVNAMYRAHSANPQDRRHQVIHAYYPSLDSLDKMKLAKMVAAVQPAFIYGEADGYPQLLPEDKQESFLPLRSYLDSGVIVASSSDAPSAHFNPFWGMYSAVTRKGMQGYQLGTKEAITPTEMLRTMTINGAYMTEDDHLKGSLEPGKVADLVVLDRNLSETPDEALKDITVEKTMIDGKFVYEK